MHDAHTSLKARCLELEVELSDLRDNHDELIKWFSNHEVVQFIHWTVDLAMTTFCAIMGYGDYVIGESVISRVYYVEGLGYNLFSVGQFCDSNLEVAFRKHACYDRFLLLPAVDVTIVNSTGYTSFTTIDQDLQLTPSHSTRLSFALPISKLHQGIAAESTLMKDNPFAPTDNDPFINMFALEPRSEASSSEDLSSTESPYVSQTLHHLRK
ncbi:hypothetical protein Tco_0245994 [Tanacetum coccineum]